MVNGNDEMNENEGEMNDNYVGDSSVGAEGGNMMMGDDKMNINIATKDEIVNIAEVSENVAQSIVDHREKNDGISDMDELRGIRNITEEEIGSLTKWFKA
jgi:hypothetical protein